MNCFQCSFEISKKQLNLPAECIEANYLKGCQVKPICNQNKDGLTGLKTYSAICSSILITVKMDQFIGDLKKYMFNRINQLYRKLFFNLIFKFLSNSDNKVCGFVVYGFKKFERKVTTISNVGNAYFNELCKCFSFILGCSGY